MSNKEDVRFAIKKQAIFVINAVFPFMQNIAFITPTQIIWVKVSQSSTTRCTHRLPKCSSKPTFGHFSMGFHDPLAIALRRAGLVLRHSVVVKRHSGPPYQHNGVNIDNL
nr:unnamed protein product [Callosobruchus chinensis]